MIKIDQVYIHTNGITLHTAQAGDPKSPPVILLHGFPEFWYGWRDQIPALSEAGYYVTAPDMRGYNLSDKPKRIRDYRLKTLAEDVVGLIDALGAERVSLVGHDWGGVVAWWVAQNYPERIAKLAILNAPHIAAYKRYFFTHPIQWLRSWYIGFFQLPLLPEAFTRWVISRPVPPPEKIAESGMMSNEDDLRAYHAAMTQPGALTAMINYYRANFRFPLKPRIADPRIHVPTLILWGKGDLYLETALAQRSADLCDDARIEYFNTTHWIQHEAPERVNAALIDFFA